MLSAQSASHFQAPVGLLSQAALDDDFRAQLQRDPVAALAAKGIHVDSRALPEYIELPSKEACGQFIKTIEPYDEGWLGYFA